MRSGRERGRWLASLLVVAALAGWLQPSYPAPDDPPPGYVWADCKACRARVLRPAAWLSKENAVACYFSPEGFSESGWLEKGLTFYACQGGQLDAGTTADGLATAEIADHAAKHGARRGTTKVGQPPGPFTTYSLTFDFDRPADGKSFVLTEVFIANRKTNTLYVWLLRSPRAEWREVEKFEDAMLKSLQLDPEF